MLNKSRLQGNDIGFIVVGFKDIGDNTIRSFQTDNIIASSLDEWTALSGSGIAPVGTVNASVTVLKIAVDGFNGGSVFFDSISFDATSAFPEPDDEASLTEVFQLRLSVTDDAKRVTKAGN